MNVIDAMAVNNLVTKINPPKILKIRKYIIR